MSHDRGCSCGREPYEYKDCPYDCSKKDNIVVSIPFPPLEETKTNTKFYSGGTVYVPDIKDSMVYLTDLIGNPVDKLKAPAYKYNEGNLLDELKQYIDSTYSEHYSGKTQILEWIMENLDGLDYLKGNVLKYVVRFGRKDGYNKKDILKALHYLLLLLYYSETIENERK